MTKKSRKSAEFRGLFHSLRVRHPSPVITLFSWWLIGDWQVSLIVVSWLLWTAPYRLRERSWSSCTCSSAATFKSGKQSKLRVVLNAVDVVFFFVYPSLWWTDTGARARCAQFSSHDVWLPGASFWREKRTFPLLPAHPLAFRLKGDALYTKSGDVIDVESCTKTDFWMFIEVKRWIKRPVWHWASFKKTLN